MSQTLFIIRGAPGSGKTTRAKALIASGQATRHFEADMWHDANGGFRWFNCNRAHAWCYDQTAAALAAGHSVVVSNTFLSRASVREYEIMAKYDFPGVRLVVETMRQGYGSNRVSAARAAAMALELEELGPAAV